MNIQPLRISLRFKTLLFVSVVMIGLALTVGTAIQRAWLTTQYAEFEKRARARVEAAALASEYGLLFNNRESLQGVVEGLRSEADILYAMVYDRNREVLAEAGPAPKPLPAATLDSGELPRLLRRNVNKTVGDIDVPAPIYWDVPIEEVSADALALGLEPETRRELKGVVQVGFSATELLNTQARNQRTIWTITAAVTILALALAFLLSSVIIINPIQRLSHATRQVAGGDLTIRVPVTTSDEIGQLASAFNNMTTELREAQEELESYHRTLEFQVAQRTDALRMANEELRRYNQELGQANRMKSEFLANMSHELRTPLNAIIGFSELLHDEVFGPLNEKQQRYVENVLNSGRHLLNLINEILDLAKVESGKMELQEEPFNPEAAVTDTANIVRALAQAKNIAIVTESPQPVGICVADPKKFKQVLYNLMSNAIKFTPDHGRVTIRVTLQPAGPTPHWLQVSVSDTGIGIEEKDQDRIFNEFEQVDGTYSRQYAGTGLGLALTRKLVELHGGKIGVRSTPGEGSTFTFTVPLKRPEGLHPDVQPSVPEGETMPLLYVGHSAEAVREQLEGFLETHGFEVTWLGLEDDALQVARRLRPRAILLDLTSDPSATYRVWHALHAEPETATLPTILFVSRDGGDQGFALCGTAHFTKPIPRDDLLTKLNALIPQEISRPGRILLVDDDEQFLEMTAETLMDAGYEVYTARNGQEGIEAAEAHVPDLMLLDLMMPGVNGFEVVTRVRSNEATAHIPILIVTAKDLTVEDIRQLNGHVSSIAQKGLFTREDLLREIVHAHGQATARF